MTDDEQLIAEGLETFLRTRGYDAPVTVEHRGGAYFFAKSPVKVPIEVWQDAVDHISHAHIPRWMAVSAPPQSSGEP